MSLFSTTGPSFDFLGGLNNSSSLFSFPSSSTSSNSLWSPSWTSPWSTPSTTQPINVQAMYKEIAKQFCKKYYETYDSDITKLESFYLPVAMFTYLEEEFVGFGNFKKKLQNLSIRSVKHEINTIDAQPINQEKLYIMITGTISVNGDFSKTKFSEFICLSKGTTDQNFYINNTMFRIVIA